MRHPLWILRSWRQALCVQDEDRAYLRSWAEAQGPSWQLAAAVPSRAGWAAAGALKPQHVARGCSPAWLPGVDCDAFAMRDWCLAATGCSAAAGGVPEPYAGSACGGKQMCRPTPGPIRRGLAAPEAPGDHCIHVSSRRDGCFLCVLRTPVACRNIWEGPVAQVLYASMAPEQLYGTTQRALAQRSGFL